VKHSAFGMGNFIRKHSCNNKVENQSNWRTYTSYFVPKFWQSSGWVRFQTTFTAHSRSSVRAARSNLRKAQIYFIDSVRSGSSWQE